MVDRFGGSDRSRSEAEWVSEFQKAVANGSYKTATEDGLKDGLWHAEEADTTYLDNDLN